MMRSTPPYNMGWTNGKLQVYLQDKTLRNQKDSRNGLWQQKLCVTNKCKPPQTNNMADLLFDLLACIPGANVAWRCWKTAFGVENGGKTP